MLTFPSRRKRNNADVSSDTGDAFSPPPRPPGGWPLLWWRFNRFLERHLPRDLYRRALLIVVVPVLLLMLLIIGIVLERHWEEVTKRLSKSFGREVGLVVRLYDKGPKTPRALRELEEMANDILKIGLSIEHGSLPPVKSRPWFSILHYRLAKYMTRFVPGRPFWIDASQPRHVEVRILVDDNLVFRFRPERERVYASSTPLLLLWVFISSAILIGIAIVFLRKQISPIIDLAHAMQDFGKGREVTKIHPRGALEVRTAWQAFLAMKERIERHMEQRAAMLAGISHDLRTILTRFRLELSLLDGDPEHIKAMKRDVDEMQHMLQGYMDFIRDAETEPVSEYDLCALVEEVRHRTRNEETEIRLQCPGHELRLSIRPGALKRAVLNVLENALRHARSEVVLRLEQGEQQVRIIIDDDGPGIPPESREAAFRPFTRLDTARNQDHAGTGLGLTIVRDIVHAHGGRVELTDSPLGGLRVIITLPS